VRRWNEFLAPPIDPAQEAQDSPGGREPESKGGGRHADTENHRESEASSLGMQPDRHASSTANLVYASAAEAVAKRHAKHSD
jgi:hypothetical protein